MTGSEFAETLREGADLLNALADIVEKRFGGEGIDVALGDAGIALKAAISALS
jgi:hypothetical protein